MAVFQYMAMGCVNIKAVGESNNILLSPIKIVNLWRNARGYPMLIGRKMPFQGLVNILITAILIPLYFLSHTMNPMIY